MILCFLQKGCGDKAKSKMTIMTSVLSDCGLKLKRRCLTFTLNSSFIYTQIKYALKEDAQFICQGLCFIPPSPSNLGRTS